MYTSVTYFPESNTFIAGEHMYKPDNWEKLEKHTGEIEPIGTINLDAQCLEPSLMKLVETYCRVKKLQQDRLCLDRMFSSPSLNGLESAKHSKNRFWPQNASDSYAVPFSLTYSMPTTEILPSDVTSALLDKRECKARAALQQLKHHYRKDKDGKVRFRQTEVPVNNDVQRITKPFEGGTYCNAKTLCEINECRTAFQDAFGLKLSYVACSVNTARALAWDTPMYEEIESAPGIGMVCEFPCMSGVQMVASVMCQNNVLYAATKYALLKHEGPKIINRNHVVLDCNIYGCAHEDPHTDEPLGFIVDLQTV